MIGETVQVTDSFKKRDIVVTDHMNEYPQDVLFQLVQAKCDLGDKFVEGQEVEVSFNLRGREWTSPQGEVKYFNTLDAWRIESVTLDESEEEEEEEEKPKKKKKKKKEEEEDDDEKDDDLPF